MNNDSYKIFSLYEESLEEGIIDPTGNNYGFNKNIPLIKKGDYFIAKTRQKNPSEAIVTPQCGGGYKWEWDTGETYYYKNKKHMNDTGFDLHRLDGPAVEYTEKYRKKHKKGDYVDVYIINGEVFSKEDYWNHPDVLVYKKVRDEVNPEDQQTALDLLDV